ncbi:MAG: shikimate kinase [Ferruginibacter sp.]
MNNDLDVSNSSANEGKNVFLVGFMGSGKTHWGRIWAANTRRSFIDLDEVIEKTAGKLIADIFETKGEDYFRKIEANALRTCATVSNTIIACGGGTPCFYDNMKWMNEHGITVYLSCTPMEVLKRVELEQEKRPLVKKLNRAELLFFIEQKLKERESYYTQAKFSVVSQQLKLESFPGIINKSSS